MCDKDILQLFFDDLNKSMPPLKISYHYISSATVNLSTDIKYVQAVCYQNMFFLEILTLEDRTNLLSQNVGMELPLNAVYNPRREQVSNHVQYQCVFLSGEGQMVEYKYIL
jgi:hypothetical protein